MSGMETLKIPRSGETFFFKVEGEVINHLQSAFFASWFQYSKTGLDPILINTGEKRLGSISVNITSSTPMLKRNALRDQIMYAFKFAKKSIKIITPYFIPRKSELDELIKCSQRGVTVEVILPGQHIDKEMARWCSRHFYGRCILNDIKIYEYQPTFIHTKLMIIDNFWSLVGSSNLDSRSLRFNEELNLNVFNEIFAKQIDVIFEKDKKQSKVVDYNQWKTRAFSKKVLDFAASHFRRLL